MSDDKPLAGNTPRRSLLLATSLALLAATLIVAGAILPAEFNKDPLGVGRLTGIARLWAPEQKEYDAESAVGPPARFSDSAARSDVIEVPLGYPGGGEGPYSLEYKVRMKKGAVLLYDWEAIGLSDPQLLAYDFHGHTLTEIEQEMTVATHRQAKGASGHGSLVAPFDGIQGWYFDNASQNSLVIRVRLHGFYELIPPGEEGNELGVIANLSAERVRAQMLSPTAGRPGSN